MSKQPAVPTRAYKIGYGCAVKNLPNRNPHVPESKQWQDFERGYNERVEICRAEGLLHPALEGDSHD